MNDPRFPASSDPLTATVDLDNLPEQELLILMIILHTMQEQGSPVEFVEADAPGVMGLDQGAQFIKRMKAPVARRPAPVHG